MSYAEMLAERYGNRWPAAIHARGYDAYLSGVQPLGDGEVIPVYRWPGGESVAEERELKQPASEFYRLMHMVWDRPRDLDDKCGLFLRQPVEWYKELALHAMRSISYIPGPEQFTHCRHDLSGWAAHHVTKAVFEEQDLFDPYADLEFIQAARKLLPWYVSRYADD